LNAPVPIAPAVAAANDPAPIRNFRRLTIVCHRWLLHTPAPHRTATAPTHRRRGARSPEPRSGTHLVFRRLNRRQQPVDPRQRLFETSFWSPDVADRRGRPTRLSGSPAPPKGRTPNRTKPGIFPRRRARCSGTSRRRARSSVTCRGIARSQPNSGPVICQIS
jgi:hypothetical protein